jgi:hypothetical protein
LVAPADWLAIIAPSDHDRAESHVPSLCRERGETDGIGWHPVEPNGIDIRPCFRANAVQDRVSHGVLETSSGGFKTLSPAP